MTLHELLRTHGIHRPADLTTRVTGLSRQRASLLWTGRRPLSRRLGQLLSETLGIPFGDLMAAESKPPPTPTPRGRPKKT